ncbi:OsmC family protein [Sphingomonas paucimobilis]|uniref:OsmC family protein n=1 Tax=Sphingomonas paucimobilis TaxID=13689 RepID=UPI0028D409E4|nr:OsmC family protein [Sphingomonas paucimobilis]MCH7862636.1 OsmC family protein [Pseudomonadota bacterium]
MTDFIVHYEGDLRCRTEHPESGAVLVTNAPQDLGGSGEGFSPSDLLSVSLGGCVLSIMAMAGRVAGLELAGTTATVTKEMGNAPRRIARLAVTVSVPGHYDAAQRKRLEAAANACPVHAVLGIDAPITIVWDETPPAT